MKIESISRAKRAYFDSNVFIYLAEGRPDLQAAASRALDAAESGNAEIVTSEIALAECLYGASRRNDERLAHHYRSLLQSGERFILAQIDLPLLDLAALIGPQSGLRLIDAVHVATAISTECDVFVTNDKGIRGRPGLSVALLEDG
ncbi:MAG: type II toxin-antitoxin system VapC family toxin [Parvularculaceae bacterium]